MSEGEKIQFTGNLALLRVCAIVYIVNVLNFVFNISFMAGHGGFFSSLGAHLRIRHLKICFQRSDC